MLKPPFLPPDFAMQSRGRRSAAADGGGSGWWRCFGHALRGLALLVRGEANARLHLAASLAVVGLGAALPVEPGDWRWLILAIALVWSAEAFNTAVERVCDLVTLDPDPRIAAAKDVAAGAVLVAAAAAAVIGLATFAPHLWPR